MVDTKDEIDDVPVYDRVNGVAVVLWADLKNALSLRGDPTAPNKILAWARAHGAAVYMAGRHEFDIVQGAARAKRQGAYLVICDDLS